MAERQNEIKDGHFAGPVVQAGSIGRLKAEQRREVADEFAEAGSLTAAVRMWANPGVRQA